MCRHQSLERARTLSFSQGGNGYSVKLSHCVSMPLVLLVSIFDGLCTEYKFSSTDLPPVSKQCDVILNLELMTMKSGCAWPVRTDELNRYVYPTGLSDIKVDTQHFGIVSVTDIHTFKGGKSDRPYRPDTIKHLKRVWNISSEQPPCVLSACCFLCITSSGGGLMTCACCMLTSHPRCVMRIPFAHNKSFDAAILGGRLHDDNMCALCWRCFV